MKYYFTILAAVLMISHTSAQNELRAGMGINFGSMPSLKDYINQVAPNEVVGSFSSSVIFSGEYDYAVSPTYYLGLEIAYLLNSYTFNNYGNYDFTYHIIMPTVTSYYVISGDGYNFKFGGGVGIRLVSFNESFPSSPTVENYKSTGFGFLARIAGNTRLSSNLYAFIATDLRYDLNGNPHNGEKYIIDTATNDKVNINSFSAGVSLGITYIF